MSARTRLRRKPERGHHDDATIRSILADAIVCHVGFVVDAQPVVIPTAFAVVGDHLYVHGATGNAMLRALASGASEACVTVTLLDGLVLSRSAFHHSVNYRSVMVFGRGEAVTDAHEKRRAVMAIVDHVVPGRSCDARPPTPEELRATLVVRIPLAEASAKVRTGPPIDDDGDLGLPHWAGEVPLSVVRGEPVPDAATTVEAPAYLSRSTA